MSDDPTGDPLEEMGPVDYLVLEFTGDRMTGRAMPLLLDLVDRGLIRVLDLVFVRKGEDGSVTAVAAADLDGDGSFDVAVLAGASSGLVGADDVQAAGAALEPGTIAAVLVYENRWAAPLAVALRRDGAQLVASGRIPVQALLAALDATEAHAGTTGAGAAR